MSVGPLAIEVLNLDERHAVLNNGAVVPITKFFNILGRETDSADDAVSFVAGAEGVGWFAGSLSNYVRASIH